MTNDQLNKSSKNEVFLRHRKDNTLNALAFRLSRILVGIQLNKEH